MQLISRGNTDQIKGIALILMFIHHFFTFPEWWMEGISYPKLAQLAPWVSSPLKICVGVFCFLTGYFYYYRKNKDYRYSLRKIIDLLLAYWCVYLILGSLAVVLCHYPYTGKAIILEMLALERPVMTFAWYVYFYVLAMLLLPVVSMILRGEILLDLTISILLLPNLVTILQTVIRWRVGELPILQDVLGSISGWFPILLMGYITAKHRIFERCWNITNQYLRKKWLRMCLALVLMFLAMAGRLLLPYIQLETAVFPVRINMDVLYSMVFVFGALTLCRGLKNRVVRILLGMIGRYSLLMWFFSCAFFNATALIFQPILYLPRNPILVLLWGLILCLIPSILCMPLIQWIRKKKNLLLY